MITVERHSHKKFWLAIVILAIVAITFLVATAWVSNELEAAQAQLTNIAAELATMQAGLSTVEIELNASTELVGSLETELLNLQANYERLTTGYGYVLMDPGYQEMQDFLTQDMTSEREYVEGEYVCVDFAADVKANAARRGIRCAYVVIEYRGETGHTIIAFDTTDEGLVFIEPQFDWEVEPEIGERYYQCVTPPSGYYMTKPGYDDTIARIIVIW
jgi:hypothetical protein